MTADQSYARSVLPWLPGHPPVSWEVFVNIIRRTMAVQETSARTFHATPPDQSVNQLGLIGCSGLALRTARPPTSMVHCACAWLNGSLTCGTKRGRAIARASCRLGRTAGGGQGRARTGDLRIFSWRTARLVRRRENCSGLSRALKKLSGRDPWDLATNHDVAVRDQSVPKTALTPYSEPPAAPAHTGDPPSSYVAFRCIDTASGRFA